MTQRTEFYKQGMALFGQNKFEEAIGAYSQALEASPDWTEAMHGLAMAQMQANRVDDAIATGKRIASIDKNDAFAHTSLSMFYQRKSQIIERDAMRRREAGSITPEELESARADAAELVRLAEEESAKARMISWKEELKKNPNAPPPGPAGSMDVIQ
jgi:tetratricopeptide (TPR) repeat protein